MPVRADPVLEPFPPLEALFRTRDSHAPALIASVAVDPCLASTRSVVGGGNGTV